MLNYRPAVVNIQTSEVKELTRGNKMGRSYPVSARISEDSKEYLQHLVEEGVAINMSEALKICIRYAKQKKMEEEI